MILLWGLPGDGPLTAVLNRLRRQRHAVVFLDQRSVLNTEIELYVDSCVGGVLRTCEEAIDLESVASAYLRPYDSQSLPVMKSIDPTSALWRHVHNFDDTLLAWAELTQALVVNRPTAMASNNSKPYQAVLIRSVGFSIPETFITTDPKAACQFLDKHGAVIYKSISSIRSIVSRLTLEHMQRLNTVRFCPTQFQQYIPGKDYRVHVVGEEIFACEILSEADDYRYAAWQGVTVEIRPFILPEEIADRCRLLVKTMGLSVAGVDLRCAPDDNWYCFEVNPSPAFTYYQGATDQPIGEAIARLLTES